MIRISFGDFDIIPASEFLDAQEDLTFWVLMLATLLITNIIFLNYIVSEASASYEVVKNQIDDHIQQQKAEMVAESQTVLPARLMDHKWKWFPTYIIIRKQAS